MYGGDKYSNIRYEIECEHLSPFEFPDFSIKNYVQSLIL